MTYLLKKPEVYRYNNGDHLSFHTKSLQICTVNANAIAAPVLISNYTDALAKENTIFMWIRRSEYTGKKAEADKIRGSTYRSLTGVVRSALRHFNPDVCNIAIHVYNLLENYGDVPRMNYDAETAAIDSVTARLLNEDYLQASTILGIIPWIEKLQADNLIFKTFVDEAMEEQLEKPDITLKEARRKTDESLREITGRVTALVTLEGAEPLVAFIEEFNELVRHYNIIVHEHQGRLHMRADLSASTLSLIPPQTWTDKPIFVIPEVRFPVTGRGGLKETVELIFSKDFTISCHNNVDPGTATLTITGIGKYKGQIVTTFNIQK
jgi:hypothetical protein